MARIKYVGNQPPKSPEQPVANVKATDAQIEQMSTAELAAYALAKFGVKVETRQSKSHLIDDVLRLKAGDE